MKLLTSNSRKQLHSYLTVVSDKPSVCGTLFFMNYNNFKVGDRRGKLLIKKIETVEKNKKNGYKCSKPINMITCFCDCGNTTVLKQENFIRRKNCGCTYGNTRYFNYSKKLYSTWRSMKNRCFWDKCPNFHNYGGRGITVCDGLLDFNVYQNTIGLPPTKDHSVDRENNEGHYSCGGCSQCVENGWPKNIRWATKKLQAENRRICYKIVVDGRLVTLKEACRIKELPYKQVHERIKRGGWDIGVALNTPVIHSTHIRYKSIKNAYTRH